MQRDARRLDGMPDREGSAADAQFVQSMLQLTITNADVKTSVLVAAIALTFGVGTPAIPLYQALEPGAWLAQAGALLGAIAVIYCGIAGMHLVLSLRPRMKQRGFSRYSLPDIVDASVDELVATTKQDDRREAWIQVKNLAEISAQKHDHIRRALTYYPISVALMIVAGAIGIVVRSGPV
ncbi:Pycsar system effector family protein [Promicromonospora thailandica]|uniref:Pycsar system effector family protein n=1 Tax=Promicromonospora thailandica TaxID=765201 RepID=UPI0020A23D9D|nr:Pycsar system effector family protein [Promicromonospora thailandica]